MYIAFAASEGVPFSKTGGLADVVGALPRSLAAAGHEVSDADLDEIRNVCRCGTYSRIREAIKAGAQDM